MVWCGACVCVRACVRAWWREHDKYNYNTLPSTNLARLDWHPRSNVKHASTVRRCSHIFNRVALIGSHPLFSR